MAWNEVAAMERRFRFRCKIDNPGFECELTALRHGIARVDRKIENDLRNLVGIGFDMGPFFPMVKIASDGNIFADQSKQ